MRSSTLNLLILMLGVAATAILVSYAVAFHSHPWGGPDAWGTLGDYVGGLLNPIVGIITVVLVRETLKATREEAESSRIELSNQTKQLELQVRHAQGEAQLNDIKRRMDGVLREWEHEMAQRVGTIHVFEDDGEVRMDNKSGITVRDYLMKSVNPGTFVKLKNTPNTGKLMNSWNDRFENCLHLLDELSTYVEEYETLAPGSNTSKYYARRVQLPLRVFRAVGIVGPDELKSLHAGLKQRAYAF